MQRTHRLILVIFAISIMQGCHPKSHGDHNNVHDQSVTPPVKLDFDTGKLFAEFPTFSQSFTNNRTEATLQTDRQEMHTVLQAFEDRMPECWQHYDNQGAAAYVRAYASIAAFRKLWPVPKSDSRTIFKDYHEPSSFAMSLGELYTYDAHDIVSIGKIGANEGYIFGVIAIQDSGPIHYTLYQSILEYDKKLKTLRSKSRSQSSNDKGIAKESETLVHFEDAKITHTESIISLKENNKVKSAFTITYTEHDGHITGVWEASEADKETTDGASVWRREPETGTQRACLTSVDNDLCVHSPGSSTKCGIKATEKMTLIDNR